MSKRQSDMHGVIERAASWLPVLFAALAVASGLHAQTNGVAPLMSGDCTVSMSGVTACAKTGGVAFAPSATTDTTNAANITTGTLNASRIPAMAKAAQGQVIYDKSYWTDTSDFIVFGAPGLSVSNGKLVSTAVNNGTFVNGFYLKNTGNDDDELDMEVVFTTGQGSGPYGIGIGKAASNAGVNAWGMATFWNGSSSPYVLQMYYVQPGGGLTQLGGTVPGAAIATGNTYRLVYSQRGTRFASMSYDFAAGTVVNNTNYVPMTSCGPKFPNSDFASVFNNGGTYTIQSIRVISRKPQQPELAVIGDSKVFGCTAGSRDLRFVSALAPVGPVAVYAGSGDTTQSVLNDLPYILANKPKAVLLNIGRNDLANGVTAPTWQGNYASIVSQLKTAGVAVVHLLPIPETTQDQTTLKSYIQTTFAGDGMIDPSAGWSNGTMLAPDGIHPNATGHGFLGASILSSGYFATTGLRPSSRAATTESLYPSTIY